MTAAIPSLCHRSPHLLRVQFSLRTGNVFTLWTCLLLTRSEPFPNGDRVPGILLRPWREEGNLELAQQLPASSAPTFHSYHHPFEYPTHLPRLYRQFKQIITRTFYRNVPSQLCNASRYVPPSEGTNCRRLELPTQRGTYS